MSAGPGLSTDGFLQAREPGTYTLRQLRASLGPVHFVLPHLSPPLHYDVYSQEPQLRVEPLTGEPRTLPLPHGSWVGEECRAQAGSLHEGLPAETVLES